MKPAISLGDLAAVTGGEILTGQAGTAVENLVIDSRSVAPGDFFVALQGERHDGHAFLPDAVARGAKGALVSRRDAPAPSGMNILWVRDAVKALQDAGRFCRERAAARVVGITGSNGKTTTKEMAAAVLRSGGKTVLSTRGNLNSQIGLPLMLMEIEPRHTHLVLEMGASAPGDIAKLAHLARPDIGVITGIGAAHLEFFGSMEGVLRGKWEIVESLDHDGAAVLNADDALLMSKRASVRGRVVTFGLSPEADVRAENIRQAETVSFDLVAQGRRWPVRLPAPGIFNVTNALAAAAVGIFEKIDGGTVVQALEKFTPPEMRMQVRRRADKVVFVVDAYNANPTSMRASLISFAESFSAHRRLAVLGSMLELGAGAQAAHEDIGALAAKLPLEAVFFNGPEGPWTKKSYERAGGRADFQTFNDNASLRSALAERLKPGDAVFFKASRGVHLEDVFKPLLEM